MAKRFDMWPHDARGIIEEALREYVGDADGIDQEVLAVFEQETTSRLKAANEELSILVREMTEETERHSLLMQHATRGVEKLTEAIQVHSQDGKVPIHLILSAFDSEGLDGQE